MFYLIRGAKIIFYFVFQRIISAFLLLSVIFAAKMFTAGAILLFRLDNHIVYSVYHGCKNNNRNKRNQNVCESM